jgi:hypothetical protein
MEDIEEEEGEEKMALKSKQISIVTIVGPTFKKRA